MVETMWRIVAAACVWGLCSAFAGPIVQGAAPNVQGGREVATDVQTVDSGPLLGLLTFLPRPSSSAVEALSHRIPHVGGLSAGRRFFAARLADFRTMVARYDMHPNDISTARAFAIVAGYRAFNGARLSDALSGKILVASLALQSVRAQGGQPWSDERKQTMYETTGAEAAAVNWSLDRALEHRDGVRLSAVRAWARDLLRRQLGRDPAGVSPDTFACLAFPSMACKDLIRELRSAFSEPDDEQTDP